jgi:hypothetical protein
MLGHSKMMLESDGGGISINPDRFDKLITALRTAIDNDWTVVDDAIRFVAEQQKKPDTITDTSTDENCCNDDIDQQNNIKSMTQLMQSFKNSVSCH